MPWRLRSFCTALLLVAVVALSGCMTPEQRMISKVERFLEREQYDQALEYLDGYLARHRKSLAGWRYRVLIRLDQEDRPKAAAEYSALSAALERHEPDVLREVVLGAGGRWLLSDYRALARCAPDGVADAAFFADIVEPKQLGSGSMSKVAVAVDEIAAVIDALPGTLPANETWPVVAKFTADPDPKLTSRVVRAAARHLETGQLTVAQTGEALDALRSGALGGADEREAALLASLDLPLGPGRRDFIATLVTSLAASGDGGRAASLFLLGPQSDGPSWTADELRVWAETAEGPLRVLAVSGLHAVEPTRERTGFLEDSDGSAEPARRLAAVAGFEREGAPSPATVWASLSPDERRRWGPAFVRTAASDRGAWASLALGDSDAITAQQAALALGLPGLGDDPEIAPALEAGMKVMDPATRAYSARAAVVRGATALSLQVQGVFSQGHARVMTEVLQGLVTEGGDDIWAPLVAQGLGADLPTIRELAVDAGVASCREGDRQLMLGLLTDGDPHVAVRAASALYLLVGAK